MVYLKGTKRKPTLLIPTSQIFHRALNITPDMVRESQLQIKDKSKQRFSLSRNFRNPSLEKISLKLGNTSMGTGLPVHSPFKVAGDLMGRIAYLSPCLQKSYTSHLPGPIAYRKTARLSFHCRRTLPHQPSQGGKQVLPHMVREIL